MRLNKYFICIFILLISFCLLSFPKTNFVSAESLTTAKSMIVIDSNSKRVLYNKNENHRR